MNKKIFLLVLLLSAVFCFADQANLDETDFQPTSVTKKQVGWRRTTFFVHGGLFDIGAGLKLRFSRENGVYLTTDIRYQYNIVIEPSSYIRIPALFYLGGNHFHFVTGGTIINVVGLIESFQFSPIGNYGAEVANGINVDFGRHFGIDLLIFTPTIWPSKPSHSLLLDFRYVF